MDAASLASTLSLNLKIHEEIGGKQMSIKTYDGTTVCELDDPNTLECIQKFGVYASSYDGEIGQVGLLVITFKSECYNIRTMYDAGP